MQIQLRSTDIADLDFVLAAESHPDNRDFISQWTRHAHEEAIASANMGHFIVEANGEGAGYAIVQDLQDPNQCIGITRLVITQKGNGYGKAVLRLLQKSAFEDWNAHRLWLDVKDYNQRARHVYESVGFRFEGILRECVKRGDRFESYAILSILKDEYKADSSPPS
jgi:diamine N-acetyltransferase